MVTIIDCSPLMSAPQLIVELRPNGKRVLSLQPTRFPLGAVKRRITLEKYHSRLESNSASIKN